MDAPTPPAPFPRRRRLAAWGVHLYTAMGLPLAWLCLDALGRGDGPTFFLLAILATWVDATDGFFARRLEVKRVLPAFDGRRLDDIVDYIHFVLLPMVALVALDLLPAPYSPVAMLPLLASGYGFCQEQAKTDDAFVGFPSYWNILALYLYVLDASPGVVVASLVVLSALVFVPIHYVYPSRTAMLQRTTLALGLAWTALVVAIAAFPEAAWARPIAWASLAYPAYYLAISFVHHKRVHGTEAHA